MICDRHLLRHFRKIVGHNIHKIRERKKMTLRYIAHKSGISIERLDRYELGKNSISLDELVKISCALDTDTSRLVAQTDTGAP